jgi:hypothetical protein
MIHRPMPKPLRALSAVLAAASMSAAGMFAATRTTAAPRPVQQAELACVGTATWLGIFSTPRICLWLPGVPGLGGGIHLT